MTDFYVGVARRFYNKNLKEAIGDRTYTELRAFTNIPEPSMSNIVNFSRRPSEEQKIAIAVALDCPVEQLFPEKYDELYFTLSKAQKKSEVEVDFVRLSSPEVLKLASEHDREEIEQFASTSIVREQLQKYIGELPGRLQTVISLRYGLDNGGIHLTLDEAAKIMKVTRERVRQLEMKAIDLIKVAHEKELREFY